MPREDNHSCCCHHEHSPNCLFLDFVNKKCGGDIDKACQILHHDSCSCYKKIIKAKSQMLSNEDDKNPADHEATAEELSTRESLLYISHEIGCPDYEHFFNTLTKGDAYYKLLEHEDEKGYLQQPLKKY